MSNVCPRRLKSAMGLTEFGPDFDKDWTDSVHDLLLDRDWTASGQMLDKDWILRPTSVQPHFSNKHPVFSGLIKSCSVITRLGRMPKLIETRTEATNEDSS